MFRLYSVFILVAVILTGCKSDGFNVKYADGSLTSATPVVVTPTPVAPAKKVPKKKDFPDEALAVPTQEVQKRRENGNDGDNETFFISIINKAEIGTCFSRRIEVKGTFEKNLSENWSSGQSSIWDSKKTSISVHVTEDTRMCGGNLIVFDGSAVIADTTFKVNKDTKSVSLYSNVIVHSNTGSIENITISIDSTQIAMGQFAGGNVSTSSDRVWGSDFDSHSKSLFEGDNITISGGFWVNNMPTNGVTYAKISKMVSSYVINGTRPADPFAPTKVSDGGIG